MSNTVEDVLGELLSAQPDTQEQSDLDICTRLVDIKYMRGEMAAEEGRLKHEAAQLTKELERRFAETDTHSVKKVIGKQTWNFAMVRHIQAKDNDPERTAQWFEENGYPGLSTVNNRRLCSILQDILQDESLGEWVNEPDRLPEGLRDLVTIGERTTLSLRSS